jgi:hypothetical protein
MSFDPGIAAHLAFAKVQDSAGSGVEPGGELGVEPGGELGVEPGGELGNDLAAATEAEERFSSGVGDDASAAYRELVAIGERHPEASYFTEFLIYATWCHLMDETTPEHFKRGLALCRRLLGQLGPRGDAERVARLRSIEQSFRAGLGEQSEDPMGYDADTLQGGD